jgi:hypothetical protein
VTHSWPHSIVRVAMMVAVMICCPASWAQHTNSLAQQTPAPPSPKPADRASEVPRRETKTHDGRQIEGEEQSRRILGVVPQFGVTSRQDAPPLSSHDKFHLFVKSAFDPATIAIVAVQSGLGQAQDEFPAYGQEAQGYGKRYGAALADEVSAGLWSNYVYPNVLREDPRYFRRGEGSLSTRVGYSLKQELVCHTDKGGRSFNFSNVLGAFTAGAISNVYYPGKSLIRTIAATGASPARPVYENDRGAELTASRAVIALGYGTLGGLFDEFWPDIHRKLFHKHESRPE